MQGGPCAAPWLGSRQFQTLWEMRSPVTPSRKIDRKRKQQVQS
jgi:hypothetical protein